MAIFTGASLGWLNTRRIKNPFELINFFNHLSPAKEKNMDCLRPKFSSNLGLDVGVSFVIYQH